MAAIMVFLGGMQIPAWADTSPEVARGLQWLVNQVQANGSLANEPQSIATPLQNRSEAAHALTVLATLPSPLVDIAVAETEDNTEYLARKAIILTLAGRNADMLLADIAARRNDDGGFGGAAGFDSNPLDTAWALLALNTAGSTRTDAINGAIAYLLAAQQTSGGYAIAGNDAHPYVSAIVATALQSGSNSAAVVSALNKTSAWLLSRQQADGGWGSVAETSVVYLALSGSTSDSGVQAAVKGWLLSQQAGDGSWGGDPYVSALALRALIAQPRPVPTTGKIALHVVDSTAGQPIAGAIAVIQGSATAPSVSDASGQITFAAVAAGTYTLNVSVPGFTAQSLNFSLQAGTTLDLGVVQMKVAPTTGILKGTVKDGATGTALEGATISVAGSANASTITAADGSYSLTGLAPGAVTVSASRTGYSAIGGTGTVVAGAVLVFSPGLFPEGQQAGTTGGISGQVVDAVSQMPLAGVTVSVDTTGKFVVTGADGKFNVTDIPGGTYPVSFSLSGYGTKTFGAVMVSAGSITGFQNVGLTKAATTVALQGKVTDINSGKAIAQATVTVLGASRSAVTDNAGNYRIEGLATGAASLRFSATGYTSETVSATFPAVGDFRLDKTLSLDGGVNPKFAALTTDRAVYPAYTPVTVQMEIANNGAETIKDAVVDVTIFDQQGQVANTQQAIRLDADGVAQNVFTFLPNSSGAVETKWSTEAYPPGTYTIKARVFTENASTGSRTVLAERAGAFDIEPSRTLMRLGVKPLPPFSNFEATEQMRFQVEAAHHSNLPVDVAFKYEFLTPAGVVLKEESGVISLQPNEVHGSIVLGPFPYQFKASGVYPVRLTSTGSITPQAIVDGEVQVAPGIRVEPSQGITPNIVTPDGDKRIRVQVKLKGVEQK